MFLLNVDFLDINTYLLYIRGFMKDSVANSIKIDAYTYKHVFLLYFLTVFFHSYNYIDYITGYSFRPYSSYNFPAKAEIVSVSYGRNIYVEVTHIYFTNYDIIFNGHSF